MVIRFLFPTDPSRSRVKSETRGSMSENKCGVAFMKCHHITAYMFVHNCFPKTAARASPVPKLFCRGQSAAPPCDPG